MTKRSAAGLAAVAWLAGSLACAGGMAREGDDTAAAPQDTTETAEPPPGYSGMEQDTTGAEQQQPTAVDTFLNEQGTGVPSDTAGYGGLEQPDTSAAAAGDTGMTDTTATTGADTSGWADTTSTTGTDTSGTSGWSDTTGTSSMDTTGQQ